MSRHCCWMVDCWSLVGLVCLVWSALSLSEDCQLEELIYLSSLEFLLHSSSELYLLHYIQLSLVCSDL